MFGSLALVSATLAVVTRRVNHDLGAELVGAWEEAGDDWATAGFSRFSRISTLRAASSMVRSVVSTGRSLSIMYWSALRMDSLRPP